MKYDLPETIRFFWPLAGTSNFTANLSQDSCWRLALMPATNSIEP
jgi:hypothetical protein